MQSYYKNKIDTLFTNLLVPNENTKLSKDSYSPTQLAVIFQRAHREDVNATDIYNDPPPSKCEHVSDGQRMCELLIILLINVMDAGETVEHTFVRETRCFHCLRLCQK